MKQLAFLIPYEDMNNIYVYDGPVGRISNKYKYGRNNNVPIQPENRGNLLVLILKIELHAFDICKDFLKTVCLRYLTQY